MNRGFSKQPNMFGAETFASIISGLPDPLNEDSPSLSKSESFLLSKEVLATAEDDVVTYQSSSLIAGTIFVSTLVMLLGALTSCTTSPIFGEFMAVDFNSIGLTCTQCHIHPIVILFLFVLSVFSGYFLIVSKYNNLHFALMEYIKKTRKCCEVVFNQQTKLHQHFLQTTQYQNAINRIRALLSDYNGIIQEKDTMISDMEGDIDVLKTENTQYKIDIKQLNHDITQRDLTLQRLQQQLDRQHELMNSQTKPTSPTPSNNKQLQTKLSHILKNVENMPKLMMAQHINGLQNKFTSMNQSVNSIESKFMKTQENYTSKYETVQAQLHETKLELREMTNQYKSKTSEFATLTTQHQTLTSELKRTQSREQELVGRCDKLKYERDNFATEVTTLTGQIKEAHEAMRKKSNEYLELLHKRTEDLQTGEEMRGLKSNYQDMISEKLRLEQTVSQLNASNKSLSTKYEELSHQHQQTQSEHDILVSTNNQLNVKYKQLQSTHETLETRFNEMYSQLETKKDELSSMQQDMFSLTNEKSRLDSIMDKHKEQLLKQNKQLEKLSLFEELEEELTSLKNTHEMNKLKLLDFNKIQDENISLQQDLMNTKQTVNKLQNEVNSLNSKLHRYREEMDHLETEKTELEASCESLEKKLTVASNTHAKLQSELDDLHSTVSTLREEVASHKDYTKTLEYNNSEIKRKLMESESSKLKLIRDHKLGEVHQKMNMANQSIHNISVAANSIQNPSGSLMNNTMNITASTDKNGKGKGEYYGAVNTTAATTIIEEEDQDNVHNISTVIPTPQLDVTQRRPHDPSLFTPAAKQRQQYYNINNDHLTPMPLGKSHQQPSHQAQSPIFSPTRHTKYDQSLDLNSTQPQKLNQTDLVQEKAMSILNNRPTHIPPYQGRQSILNNPNSQNLMNQSYVPTANNHLNATANSVSVPNPHLSVPYPMNPNISMMNNSMLHNISNYQNPHSLPSQHIVSPNTNIPVYQHPVVSNINPVNQINANIGANNPSNPNSFSFGVKFDQKSPQSSSSTRSRSRSSIGGRQSLSRLSSGSRSSFGGRSRSSLSGMGASAMSPGSPTSTNEIMGCRVQQISPDGFAADLGLQPGDVILSFNNQHTNTPQAFNHIKQQLTLIPQKQQIPLVYRHNNMIYTHMMTSEQGHVTFDKMTSRPKLRPATNTEKDYHPQI